MDWLVPPTGYSLPAHIDHMYLAHYLVCERCGALVDPECTHQHDNFHISVGRAMADAAEAVMYNTPLA